MTIAIHRPRSTDLVRFLLTRLDEDEAELKRLARQKTRNHAEVPGDVGVRRLSRQLAEVDAKRRVIASIQRLIVLRDQPMEKAVRDQATLMLQALAAPYSDKGGFRDEWRVAGS